jgi:hypothetical protein
MLCGLGDDGIVGCLWRRFCPVLGVGHRAEEVEDGGHVGGASSRFVIARTGVRASMEKVYVRVRPAQG